MTLAWRNFLEKLWNFVCFFAYFPYLYTSACIYRERRGSLDSKTVFQEKGGRETEIEKGEGGGKERE